ncbi:PA-phosphatase related-family protein [Cyphellophora attinorum]|uniref:PA-phosphatase related-family protein n=1 Tax=Cyphellophora attinorum TaxID=1664694 RepID=A0A0N0NSD1_9EURO|nr:PA-phosphatase related-family protein [Phialophora attinorum]KPI45869.1 PA-phosphatase related-family protein [Phialophora attinorum]
MGRPLQIRTALSYVFDWLVIIAFAAGGGVLSNIRGFRRPFSLADRSIAYPRRDDIVTLEVAGLVVFVGPAAIILVLALVTPAARQVGQKRLYSSWVDKIWDANAGWMGLALASAATLFLTSGLKCLVGKPRPNFLAICDADVDRLSEFVVGGSGSRIESDAPALVTYEICRQSDLDLLNDAFFAFPSGHSSMSWAGLLYLSLWLSMRFSVAIPYLGHHMPLVRKSTEGADLVSFYHARKAAPPLWMVAIVLVPIGVALFICASRYADFHHAGIDIFAGSVIGIVCGYSSFRLYHLPIRRGHGLAWAPRQKSTLSRETCRGMTA